MRDRMLDSCHVNLLIRVGPQEIFSLEIWNEKATICFYAWMVGAGPSVAHTHCVCAGSPCWCEVASRLPPVLPSTGSSFSFSNSWARCVFNAMTKGTNFCSRTPTSARYEAVRTDMGSSPLSWIPAHSHGIQVPLLSPSPVHQSALPDNFSLQTSALDLKTIALQTLINQLPPLHEVKSL